MNAGLLEIAKIVKISNGAGAAQTELDGTAVDMSGFDAVCFVADLGAVTDGCVLTLAAQQGLLANGSDAAAFSPAISSTFTASGSSNSLLATDVIRPSKRYVRPALTRTAQNAVVNTLLAILYRPKTVPTAKDATMLAQTVAPAAS